MITLKEVNRLKKCCLPIMKNKRHLKIDKIQKIKTLKLVKTKIR